MHRTAPDELLFFLIDGIKRTAKFLTAAGLDLRKDKRLSVAADKIDLPAPGRAEIFPQDLPSTPFEMSDCLPLPPVTQLEMPLRS